MSTPKKRPRGEGAGPIPVVERLCPGWRVIAGALKVDSIVLEKRREERAFALKVIQEQQAAGTQTKLVMFRGEAFVLRSAVGWKDKDEAKKAFRSTVKGAPLSVWEVRK